ncbi:MAG: hypothetical protein WB998_10285 [Solirubrobacteraceae bacterium]
MIALAVAAAWIAISIVGAKGLVLFARAAATGTHEVDRGPAAGESGANHEDTGRPGAGAHIRGASFATHMSGVRQ